MFSNEGVRLGEGEGGFERDREDRGARKREEIDTGGQ